MAAEIKTAFSGDWVHIQDDHLPPFYDAVGVSGDEKEFMLNSTPKMTFSVDGDVISSCNIPNPESAPDIKADVKFKLGEQFQIEPSGHTLQVVVEYKDGKMIQNITPIQSPTLSHTVELSIDPSGDLTQVYSVTDDNDQVVRGKRRYRKVTELDS